MVKFLAYQPGNIQKGDLSTVQQIIDAFAKEQQAGLIEVEWLPGKQGTILLADGQIMGVNVLEATFCKKISYEQLPAHWQKNQASLRSVQTNLETVRAVMAMLEWYPPNQTFSLQGDEFSKYLEVSQKYQHNGLFRMLWDDLEGYIFLLAGQPLQHESISNSASKSLTGAQAHEQLIASASKALSLEFYEAGLASAAYQQICFRFAFVQLLQGMLNRYARLVGAEMVETLASTVNQQLKKRQYHLALHQDQLDDAHVFPSFGVAMQAYRFLFKNIMDQISEVIGSGLAHSIAFEVFRSLPPKKQQFLRESPLMIMIISST